MSPTPEHRHFQHVAAGHQSFGAECPNCTRYAKLGRRGFLAALGLGVAAAVAACNPGRKSAGPSTTIAPPSNTATTRQPNANQLVRLDAIPPPRPGPPRTISKAPGVTHQLALTIDDGYCSECVSAYVTFAEKSGVHITFSPNGRYKNLWDPVAPVLRPLIEAGQVQIGNHTFSHKDLTTLAPARIREEIEHNEAWIQSTFGITSRPWLRPPFGRHNATTDHIAGQAGFTNVVMWNGTFGDATLLTPAQLMEQAQRWLRPGTIMLGHANHPTVTQLFDQIQGIMAARGLNPVTLDEMFGTSRMRG